MNKAKEITEELKEYYNEYFKYDSNEGSLVYKKIPKGVSKSKLNCEAGTKNMGYRSIQIKGKAYLAHRLIWFCEKGYQPEYIDHINGNKLDNRLSNLRSVSYIENNKNAAMRSDNKSGQTGVCWCKRELSWRVTININKKQKHIGMYKDLQEAIEVRKEAEIKYDFHENHGR